MRRMYIPLLWLLAKWDYSIEKFTDVMRHIFYERYSRNIDISNDLKYFYNIKPHIYTSTYTYIKTIFNKFFPWTHST